MSSSLLQVDGHAAVSRHEKELFNADPALNREEREEVILQKQLDNDTVVLKAAEEQKHRSLQREINRINRTIDVKFADLIGDSPGLEVINPGIEGQHGIGGVGGRAPVGPLVTPSEFAASPGTTASRSARSRVPRRGLPGPPPLSTRSGPPIPGQSISDFAIGFPIPFEESGFNSVVRWADISLEETLVAALGPGANPEQVRMIEMPQRVLVSVACYLLNEVLRRDPNVRDLWAKLRAPIMDAVFSPNLIAAEMAKRQTRLKKKPPSKTIGSMFMEMDNAQADKSTFGFLDRPPSSSGHFLEDRSKKEEKEVEYGVLDPFPIRYTNYENQHDYANYCLWTEELINAKRMNDQLSQRVEQLKDVVVKSRLVLAMAGRRVDRYRKQFIFSAWRTYTDRMKRFRHTATVYITNARKRQLIESSFLKWRRVPLQEKVANLQLEVMELRRKLQMVQETHQVEVATLKANTREAQDQLQDMALKDEALRNQMLESHRVETTGLRSALSKATQGASQLFKHARRWERLAKTLRPPVLCKSVPKPMMIIALELKHVEEEALGSSNLHMIRDQVARSSCTLLEQMLLRWVNAIMMVSPQKKNWVQMMSFARHVGVPHGAHSGGPPAPTGPAAHLLGPLPEPSDPSLFGPSALLAFIRELRRLQPPERPDLTTELQLAATMSQANSTFGTTTVSSTGDHDSTASGGTASPGMAPVAPPPSPFALYQELTELLHYYSCEGLCPSLLQQCPFLDVFYNPLSLAHLTNTISMLWVLSALFTGYVTKMLMIDAMLGPTPRTAYLRTKIESSVAKKPNPTLTGVIPGDYVNVPESTWEDVAAARVGSYVIATNTSIRKSASGSPAPWSTGERANSPTSLSGTATISRTFNFRVTDYRDIDVVRDNVDTASDMEVYLGSHEEDLPPSEEDYDVDDIMAEMVKAEELEIGRRRRGKNSILTQAESTVVPAEGEEGDDARIESGTDWHPHSSLGEDDEIEETESSAGGVTQSNKIPFYWEKDDETFVGVREIQRTTLDLEAQIVKERKKNAAQAAAFLMHPKEDILSVEQVHFLHLIPRPSKAFDLVPKKPKFKKKGQGRSFNLQSSRSAMTPMSKRGSITSSASGMTFDLEDPRAVRRQIRRVSVLTFLKRLVRDNAHRQQWIGVARIVTSLICRLRVLDTGHGVPTRKWGEGMAVDNGNMNSPQRGVKLTSPIALRRPGGKAHNGGSTNNTSTNSASANNNGGGGGRHRKSKAEEDDSFLYDNFEAHQHVGGFGEDKMVNKRSSVRKSKPSFSNSGSPQLGDTHGSNNSGFEKSKSLIASEKSSPDRNTKDGKKSAASSETAAGHSHSARGSSTLVAGGQARIPSIGERILAASVDENSQSGSMGSAPGSDGTRREGSSHRAGDSTKGEGGAAAYATRPSHSFQPTNTTQPPRGGGGGGGDAHADGGLSLPAIDGVEGAGSSVSSPNSRGVPIGQSDPSGIGITAFGLSSNIDERRIRSNRSAGEHTPSPNRDGGGVSPVRPRGGGAGGVSPLRQAPRSGQTTPRSKSQSTSHSPIRAGGGEMGSPTLEFDGTLPPGSDLNSARGFGGGLSGVSPTGLLQSSVSSLPKPPGQAPLSQRLRGLSVVSGSLSLSRSLMMDANPNLATNTLGPGMAFPGDTVTSRPGPPLLDLTNIARQVQHGAGAVPSGDLPMPGQPDLTYTPPQHILDQLTVHRNIRYVSPSQPKPNERFELGKSKK